MKNLAAIIAFVYARPEHTKRMLDSLIKNDLAKDSDMFIFSDNTKKEKDKKKVKEVRNIIHSYEDKGYFKSLNIIEATQNKGLANSVIDGVSAVIQKYGKVIVIEDDLILSEMFLKYMNDSLDFYKDDKSIWSISGYNIPMTIPKEYNNDIYLSYRGCSWGWATWDDRWNKVDWNVTDYKKFKHSISKRGKFNKGGNDMSQMLDAQMKGLCDSWAIRWCYAQSKVNMYTVYPINTLVENHGLDGTGTHSGISNKYDVKIGKKSINLDNNISINKEIAKEFKKIYDGGTKQRIIEILTICGLDKIVDIARKVKNGKF